MLTDDIYELILFADVEGGELGTGRLARAGHWGVSETRINFALASVCARGKPELTFWL